MYDLGLFQNDSVDKTIDPDANLMTTSKIRSSYYSPHTVSIKMDCGLRTTDCGLGIKYGLGIKRGLELNYGLGIKHGQGINRGLRTADWV